jgi:hypothetical protein
MRHLMQLFEEKPMMGKRKSDAWYPLMNGFPSKADDFESHVMLTYSITSSYVAESAGSDRCEWHG